MSLECTNLMGHGASVMQLQRNTATGKIVLLVAACASVADWYQAHRPGDPNATMHYIMN